MTKRKPLPPIAQCDAIGPAMLVVERDPHATTGKYCMVCARRAVTTTWISGPICKTERGAINAWNRWMSQLRFGEWRPA